MESTTYVQEVSNLSAPCQERGAVGRTAAELEAGPGGAEVLADAGQGVAVHFFSAIEFVAACPYKTAVVGTFHTLNDALKDGRSAITLAEAA